MTIAVILDPFDVLFCRDGRPIVPGEGAAAGASLPFPQVLAGAIRTALLKQRGGLVGQTADAEKLKRIVAEVAVRGPLLYDRTSGRPLIPCPADLVACEKPKHGQSDIARFLRLAPLASDLPGWDESRPPGAPHLRPLWNLEATKNSDQSVRLRAWHAQPGWLTWSGFEAWVRGGAPTSADHRMADKLFQSETRTQVALDAGTATADPGKLFSTRYLRLCKNIALYAELDGADELVPPGQSIALSLGGDRRLCQVERTDEPVPWPQRPSGPTTLLALTPTILDEPGASWPAILKDRLAGCAIPGTEAVSGWDLVKNRPKPTRFACRAGSVWHLTSTAANLPSRLGQESDLGFGWIAYGAWLPPQT